MGVVIQKGLQQAPLPMASKKSVVDILYLFLIFLLILQELHGRLDLVKMLSRLSMSLFCVVALSREVMRFQLLLRVPMVLDGSGRVPVDRCSVLVSGYVFVFS